MLSGFKVTSYLLLAPTNASGKRNVTNHSTIIFFIQEQIEWAVKGGADFIVGETFVTYGEAALCLKAIKEFGKGKN